MSSTSIPILGELFKRMLELTMNSSVDWAIFPALNITPWCVVFPQDAWLCGTQGMTLEKDRGSLPFIPATHWFCSLRHIAQIQMPCAQLLLTWWSHLHDHCETPLWDRRCLGQCLSCGVSLAQRWFPHASKVWRIFWPKRHRVSRQSSRAEFISYTENLL